MQNPCQQTQQLRIFSAAPAYFPTCPFTLMHILCLGYRLICFAAKGAKTKHRRSSLPSRSFAIELSQAYFPRLPLRPPCLRFHLTPSRALPKLFPTASCPSTLSSLPSRSLLHNGALPTYFPRLPLRHLVVASISLLPNGALPKLFPTVSPPSTISSLPSRSFPTELSSSYFPCTVSSPSTLSSLPSRSFPTQLSPTYFPCFGRSNSCDEGCCPLDMARGEQFVP